MLALPGDGIASKTSMPWTLVFIHLYKFSVYSLQFFVFSTSAGSQKSWTFFNPLSANSTKWSNTLK